MQSYVSRWVATAFDHSIGPIDMWTGIAAAILGIIDHYLPGLQLMTTLVWQVPIWVLVAIVVVRLILAPYRMAQEDQAKIASLEAIITSLRTADPSINLELIIRRRSSFTIAEAACLLAETEIRHENLTSAAAMHLRDLKKQILDESVKPLKSNPRLAMARLFAQTGEENLSEISNDTEISKAVLKSLAGKCSVQIPGLD